MHPLTALDLATQHQADLRAAAARQRLASASRRLRRSQPARPDPPPASLAERLATFGPGTLTIELHRFARDARIRGACPLLLDVLTDSAQPDIARLRAFGRIMADIERPAPATTTTDQQRHDAA